MEFIALGVDLVMDKIAEVIVAVRPSDASPKHFYVPPHHHISEAFFVNLVALIMFIGMFSSTSPSHN
jgi:hypothetical protein